MKRSLLWMNCMIFVKSKKDSNRGTGVGRVIARPLLAKFRVISQGLKTERLLPEPVDVTMLDRIVESGKTVCSRKISSIFAGKGISKSNNTVDNMDTVDAVLEYLDEMESAFSLQTWWNSI